MARMHGTNDITDQSSKVRSVCALQKGLSSRISPNQSLDAEVLEDYIKGLLKVGRADEVVLR